MDDLTQQINQFLGNPDNMRQLQAMMGSLGIFPAAGADASGQKAAQAPPAPAPDLSALAGVLGALGGGSQQAAAASPPSATPDTLAMVTKLAPLLGQINQEDDSTRLLRALRPLLSGARQQKIDEAVKILQLMRLLPLIRDMGGLPGLL